MVRRISWLAGAIFLTSALVSAFADVTFVLKNGDRASGQLTYKAGVGDLGVTENGRQRMFPFDDIALIQFTGGDPSRAELEKLPTSDNPPESERHMLVLKSGEAIRGKYHGFEGDRMTFDVWNSAGSVDRRTINLSDVARMYLSASASRNVFNNILHNAPAAAPAAEPPSARERRRPETSVEVQVQANRGGMTDTGLIVNQGDRIRFEASGTIKIDPQISTGPEGSKSLVSRRTFPIPNLFVGALIGRVGNGAPFAIGSQTAPLTMPATGRLYLGINDDKFTDNSGAFTVKIWR